MLVTTSLTAIASPVLAEDDQSGEAVRFVRSHNGIIIPIRIDMQKSSWVKEEDGRWVKGDAQDPVLTISQPLFNPGDEEQLAALLDSTDRLTEEETREFFQISDDKKISRSHPLSDILTEYIQEFQNGLPHQLVRIKELFNKIIDINQRDISDRAKIRLTGYFGDMGQGKELYTLARIAAIENLEAQLEVKNKVLIAEGIRSTFPMLSVLGDTKEYTNESGSLIESKLKENIGLAFESYKNEKDIQDKTSVENYSGFMGEGLKQIYENYDAAYENELEWRKHSVTIVRGRKLLPDEQAEISNNIIQQLKWEASLSELMIAYAEVQKNDDTERNDTLSQYFGPLGSIQESSYTVTYANNGKLVSREVSRLGHVSLFDAYLGSPVLRRWTTSGQMRNMVSFLPETDRANFYMTELSKPRDRKENTDEINDLARTNFSDPDHQFTYTADGTSLRKDSNFLSELFLSTDEMKIATGLMEPPVFEENQVINEGTLNLLWWWNSSPVENKEKVVMTNSNESDAPEMMDAETTQERMLARVVFDDWGKLFKKVKKVTTIEEQAVIEDRPLENIRTIAKKQDSVAGERIIKQSKGGIKKRRDSGKVVKT
jgi:hypothetical protein